MENRGDKTAANVYYEWQHVLRGDQKVPHRVATRVNHILESGRKIPSNPLDKHTPSNLWFTVEFIQTFAESVLLGTEFAGVSFEVDHPDIVVQVPDGGLDIQDHPIHWTLPCGRT